MDDMQNSTPRSPGFFEGNPKMIFTFGLVTGIAVSLFLSTLTGFAAGNGSLKLVGTGNGNTPTVVDDGTGAPVAAGKLADEVTKNDHIRGDLKKAKVVVVEYSDFQCPFCERHHPTMKQIFDTYGDDVAWVYRHFPLSFHPEAAPAALASECASEQGKFWEYSDKLFENQDLLGTDYYAQLAGELGLNTSKFQDCFDSAKYQSVVDEQTSGGRSSGVNGTPATFINGVMVTGASGQSVGAAPFSVFQQIIDAELAK